MFTLEFCFCSISPEPLELFSLDFTQIFPSSRWFAELMTWQIDSRSRSYFKVLGFTLQFGVGSLDPLWMIFTKLHSNVLLGAWISYPYWRSHFKVKRFCWRSLAIFQTAVLITKRLSWSGHLLSNSVEVVLHSQVPVILPITMSFQFLP